MFFEKGQMVTVLEKNNPLCVDRIVDITSDGEIRLSSGKIFDRHGRSKSGDLWQCAYIDEYVNGDETLVKG